MTAVEWLVQQLSKEWQLEDRDLHLIEQAKEMEKKQIMQTRQDIYVTGDLNNEQYYNETFNKQ